MKWELIGKDTIIIDDIKFSTGGKWLPPVKEPKGFQRKFKANNLLISTSTNTGCIVESDSAVQIYSCNSSALGHRSLSANFFGNANALYFAKVSDDYFWVVSYDENGLVDVADDSDSLKDLYHLRDYIREVVELSYASAEFKVINIGERVILDDPMLDSRIEHSPLTESGIKELASERFIIKKQAGNLKTKLYGAGFLIVGGLGLGIYSLVTSMPDDIVEISNGEHSRDFSAKYNKIKREYNSILTSEKKKQVISEEKILLLGREEFNDYVLSRGLSNKEIIENVLKIREKSPIYINGWERKLVRYINDKFVVEYQRLGDYPISSPYTNFDSDFVSTMTNRGFVVTPVSLKERGTIREYDVAVERNLQQDYSKYVSMKRETANRKNASLTDMRQSQQQLDSIKKSIESVESSVYELGIFDRRDNETIDSIVSKISELKLSSVKHVNNMNKSIEDFNKIQIVEPPLHNDKLLSESGIEQELFPIFQSTNLYSWSNPVSSHSFPNGVTDNKFRDLKVIKGSSINISFKDSIHGIWVVNNLIEKPYSFVDGMSIEESGGKNAVNLTISFNELNQSFIF